MSYFWVLIVLVAVLALAWRYLGSYMEALFAGRLRFLVWAEQPVYKLLDVSPELEQPWQRYAGALIIFSGTAILFTYALQRAQGSLPLNPQHLGAVPPALAWNTAVSFVTNTNWQNYAGETTMSYLTQIAALTTQQFVSAAVGIAVAVALVRGFARRGSPTIGNFWVDIVRCTI
jgi:K+-transporting ATPase ATPase A chain